MHELLQRTALESLDTGALIRLETTDACAEAERKSAESDRRRQDAEVALSRGQQTWFETSQRLRTQLQAALDKPNKSGTTGFVVGLSHEIVALMQLHPHSLMHARFDWELRIVFSLALHATFITHTIAHFFGN